MKTEPAVDGSSVRLRSAVVRGFDRALHSHGAVVGQAVQPAPDCQSGRRAQARPFEVLEMVYMGLRPEQIERAPQVDSRTNSPPQTDSLPHNWHKAAQARRVKSLA